MRAGKLNREITVMRKAVESDPNYGTEVVTWVPLSVLPGSPEVAERFAAEIISVPLNRDEGEFRSDLAISRIQQTVRMRWRNDIDSTMRVILHGDTDRTMEIIGGPTEIGGRKEAIEMLCEEISS